MTNSDNSNEPNEMHQALALDKSNWGHRHKHWIGKSKADGVTV